MSADFLQRIRDAASRVAAEARHVRIDRARLAAYARSLPPLDGPTGDIGHVHRGDDEATASFVVSLDAINFGSGYFPYLTKRPGLSGYHTVAAGLRDHVEATGALTPDRLMEITSVDCAQIFGQDLDGGLQQDLMERFATALRDLGAHVTEFGDFTALVESADRSAAALAENLASLPYYRDVWTYHGFDVPLYKRAQITPYDLAVAFDHEGLGRFDDIDQLTMFADNLVPHVLRVDGVLAFTPDLTARIDAVEDIPAGSEEEVEIRACGLHAVELIVAELDGAATAGQVDSFLWARGADPRYKAVPRHRSRSVAY